jgi:hypothetical protein
MQSLLGPAESSLPASATAGTREASKLEPSRNSVGSTEESRNRSEEPATRNYRLPIAMVQSLQVAMGNAALAKILGQQSAAKGQPAQTKGPPKPAALGSAQARERPAAIAGQATDLTGPSAGGTDTGTTVGSGPAGRLEPPAPPLRTRPRDDPGFTALTGAAKEAAAGHAQHGSGQKKAVEAQGAAESPSDDLAAQAKTSKLETMKAKGVGTFDTASFTAALEKAIEAKTPKNLEEADEFADSGKVGEVSTQVSGFVAKNTSAASSGLDQATAAPPDPSKSVPKAVTPMADEIAHAVPFPGSPAAGTPKSAPANQTNLSAGPNQLDQTMAEADVTERQLAESNEPAFAAALQAKQSAGQHAATGPAAFREAEGKLLTEAKGEADSKVLSALAGMKEAKTSTITNVNATKHQTKGADEARRAEISNRVNQLFGSAEADVKRILDGLNTKADTLFAAGEKQARVNFEQSIGTKMSDYKKARYSGLLGKGRWAKDKLFGMPSTVNKFYTSSRTTYLAEMRKVITQVASVVTSELNAAQARIAQGRTEISNYTASLPKALQRIGAEAGNAVDQRFSQLESDVHSKEGELIDSLATQYSDLRNSLDDRIESMQAENKGLVDKAVDAIGAVINTVRNLANLLKNAFARAAGAVGSIIKKPIEFLGNLVSGVKGGILRFRDNILTHLRKGLMSWLFGTLAKAGITLPDSFDIKGVISLLADLFGLTWSNIRTRLVKAVGERAVGVLEKTVNIFSTLATQGPAGLWQMLMEKIGDVKEMIVERAKEFVLERVIMSGVTWLIGLLNPAAAFIKACKAIYDIVSFFVQNASKISSFVNTVLDSASDIAKGAVGGVSEKIEKVLGDGIPLVIGFLANLLGIGGLGKKIREIVETLQKPVTKAIDAVIKTGLKIAGPVIRSINKVSGKVKSTLDRGKAWAKERIDQGKAWATGKVTAAKGWAQEKRDRGVAFFRGLFKKPFAVAGKPHTLYANASEKGVTFLAASKKASLAEHLQAANTLAIAKGKKGVGDEALNAIARSGSLQTKLANNRDPKKLQDAVTELAVVVRGVWERIGYHGDLETHWEDNGKVGKLGEVGPHGQQGSRGYADKNRQEKDRLESEHVIPRAWILSFVAQLFGSGLGERADKKLYNKMTTIMLYVGAADRKTEKKAVADNVAGPKVKALLQGSGRAKDPEAVASVVRQRFDGPMASRIRLTKQARDAEHKANQRTGSPEPSDAAIEKAAIMQLLDVIKFLSTESLDEDAGEEASAKKKASK